MALRRRGADMGADGIDELDRRLLDRLQRQMPLVPRPFQHIADELDLTEPDVIARVSALRGSGGVIRQISAIFDSRMLGYRGCLVGAKVAADRLDQAAEIINRHPGVSHNYRRDHAYNLWYTVTVPPDSVLGLERTVELLHAQSGAIVTRLMPTLRMYKIGVKFDLSGESDPTDRSTTPGASPEAPVPTLTPRDRQMIRVLQQDLPAEPQPFDVWAAQAGTGVQELLEAARSYQEAGVMRRFSAVLRHRKAGFGANAMGAWVVPPEECDAFGAIAAGFAAVSHCYRRPTYEDWPYSMFTMVHGRDRSDCEQTLRAIADATGIREHAALYSTHEYKKVRVRYFTDAIAIWEHEHTGASA